MIPNSSALRRAAAKARNMLVASTGSTCIMELWWKYYHHLNRPGSLCSKATVGLQHPHRDLVVAAVGNAMPADSILEVGCHLGYNLERVHTAFPNLRLMGADINGAMIDLARQRFGESSVPATFAVARADRLDLADKCVDIVLTDAVLMYVGPRRIHAAIDEIIRVCRKRVILVEFTTVAGKGQPSWCCWNGKWVFDFAVLFKERMPECKAVVSPLGGSWEDPGWSRFGSVTTISLETD